MPKEKSPAVIPTKKQVIHVLKQCLDPELDMDVWTLGLIYELKIDAAKKSIKIRMTLTSPMCPFGRELMDQIESGMHDIGFEAVDIDLVFDPPWRPSEDVKTMLGIG